MRVNDKDRALRTVKLFHDEPDQGFRRRESPSGRALLPLDLRSHGQATNSESEPELFGVVKEAVDRAVRVLDG